MPPRPQNPPPERLHEARAKIVATVGPASRAPSALAALARAGVDVFRCNGAHTPPEAIAPLVSDVARTARRTGRSLAVLLDLPGVKLRIGRLPGGGMELAVGDRLRIVRGAAATRPAELAVPRVVLDSMVVGAEVLLGDGTVALRVESRGRGGTTCLVEAGGALRERAGVHVRDAKHPGPVLTARDLRLAEAGVAAGVDALAISFVRGPEDVARLRRHLVRRGLRVPVLVAKIERREALERIEGILGASDGIMVARGDLGLELGPAETPGAQKRLLDAALRHGRLAITATQMLESMTTARRPTRAEATDVANAVFDGTDAVMLSGETAVGAHPALVVDTMNQILLAAEADSHCPFAGDTRHPVPIAGPTRPDRLVVRAAVRLAMDAEASAIVVFTRGGQSARRVAKERPRAPIFAYAADDAVRRGLLLSWGVRPRHLPDGGSTDAIIRHVLADLRRTAHLRRGDRVVLVMGAAEDPAGATSIVKLMTV